MECVLDLVCIRCQARHPAGDLMTCPACDGLLDVAYDYARARATLTRAALGDRAPGLWRYRELLPVRSPELLPPLATGGTPILEAPRLAAALGLARVWLQDDGRNPTGSLKDRASALGVAKAREYGAERIVCASTGNAASSLAGAAAAAGLPATIFVPARAPQPKLVQLLVFGAQLFQVDAGYDATYDLAAAAAARFGWYSRNCAVNPYLVEGKKTSGLEIGETLGLAPPDWVAVSVGDGCTIAGIGKGLREMVEVGICARMPRLLGVQAAGADAVASAFESGGELVEMTPETVADSIAVGVPRNWRKAVDAVRGSGGAYIRVRDEQILEAMRVGARMAGVFGEPAAAAAVAGIAEAVRSGVIAPHETALAVVSGNGLKDVATASTAVGAPHRIPADLDAVAAVIERLG